jgi:hypothetical protein
MTIQNPDNPVIVFIEHDRTDLVNEICDCLERDPETEENERKLLGELAYQYLLGLLGDGHKDTPHRHPHA